MKNLQIRHPDLDETAVKIREISDWACDTHLHCATKVGTPNAQTDNTNHQVLDFLKTIGCGRGVLVQPSFGSITYEEFLTVSDGLGPCIRGVTRFQSSLESAQLAHQRSQGIVAIRLTYTKSKWEALKSFFGALSANDMHVHLLLNTHKHMLELESEIRAAPVPIVIDHMGWPDLKIGAHEPGFDCLVRLLSDGKAFVKLSALYRLCPPPYTQADTFIARLVSANPDGLIWGSDWPYLENSDEPLPAGGAVMDTLLRNVKCEATLKKILVDTPAKLFDF